MAISLSTAPTLIEAAFAKGHELSLKPLSVVVLDPRAAMVAVMSQDGVSQMRARIAHGKTNAAIAMGMGTRVDEPRRTAGLFCVGHQRACL